MIIAIHGLGSTGEGSSTCQSIKKHFEKEEVVTPTWDITDPVGTATALKEIAEAYKQRDTKSKLHIVGISFGGFLARWLANEFSDDVAGLIMINPVLDPSLSLKRRLGENKSFVTGDSFYITEGHIEAYGKLVVAEGQFVQSTKVILGMKDDVVNPALALSTFGSTAAVVQIAEGGHRLSEHSDQVLREISSTIEEKEILLGFRSESPFPLWSNRTSIPSCDISSYIGCQISDPQS